MGAHTYDIWEHTRMIYGGTHIRYMGAHTYDIWGHTHTIYGGTHI
jgi:hypothetical protein